MLEVNGVIQEHGILLWLHNISRPPIANEGHFATYYGLVYILTYILNHSTAITTQHKSFCFIVCIHVSIIGVDCRVGNLDKDMTLANCW